MWWSMDSMLQTSARTKAGSRRWYGSTQLHAATTPSSDEPRPLRKAIVWKLHLHLCGFFPCARLFSLGAFLSVAEWLCSSPHEPISVEGAFKTAQHLISISPTLSGQVVCMQAPIVCSRKYTAYTTFPLTVSHSVIVHGVGSGGGTFPAPILMFRWHIRLIWCSRP